MADEATFSVEILTPEGEVFNGEVTRLSTRTVIGTIGVLANHVPVLAGLKPTKLTLYVPDSEPVEYAQAHGTFQVFANQAEILVEEAIPVDSLDVASLEAQLEDAQTRLGDEDAGEGTRAIAEKDLERVETFLEIARGS